MVVFPKNKYYKGLGGPYYEKCDAFMSPYTTEKSLVYYKKGDREEGAPLIITDIYENLEKGNICVFPNPASDFIDIRLPKASDYIIEIFSSNGILVKNFPANHKTYKIDVSEFNSEFSY